MKWPIQLFLFSVLLFSLQFGYSQIRLIDNRIYHLRVGKTEEWKNFKGRPQKNLLLHFTATQNPNEQTLTLRQEDVKQDWAVQLNGNLLGKLQQDENTMTTYLQVAPGLLRNGKNELRIYQVDTVTDDISVGEFVLAQLDLYKFLHQATIEVAITDHDSKELLPAHLTLLNRQRSLQPLAITANPLLAARTGCIYTGNGKAMFSIPAGTYTLFVNRGFEYSVDSARLIVKAGDHIKQKFSLEKEVHLEGWISCDTHIHTRTYSGHGDATMTERLNTLAGEGIDFPILTEHNFCANIDSLSRALNLRKYFTPVAGDEYTTVVGHFNIFPLNTDSVVPDYRVDNWNDISHKTGDPGRDRVIILNHARDVHNGFRPFDPRRHIAPAGIERDGWKFPANSMEVINSGSQQFDIMQLYRDWFGMMNRGKFLTPVGSSDSHDVSRFLVGQARTYIRYNGNDYSNINTAEAIRHFLDGEVMVSFGLVVEMNVDSGSASGSKVLRNNNVTISINVMGPSWAEADSVFLFANGAKIRGEKIKSRGAKGIKWQGEWVIPVHGQDMYFVAIATGPDPERPFWPIPKPFQPTSTEWTPKIIGSSGALWVDVDRDGKNTSAYDYAVRLIAHHSSNMIDLIKDLNSFDEAVSVQAASILMERGVLPSGDELRKYLINASPPVRKGFVTYLNALKGTHFHGPGAKN